MKKLSLSIAIYLYRKGNISFDQIDQCRFGLELIGTNLFVFSSTIFLGFMINHLISIVFIDFVFITLRHFSDGYHAKTFKNCFILTNMTCLTIIFLGSFNTGQYSQSYFFILWILTLIILHSVLFYNAYIDEL